MKAFWALSTVLSCLTTDDAHVTIQSAKITFVFFFSFISFFKHVSLCQNSGKKRQPSTQPRGSSSQYNDFQWFFMIKYMKIWIIRSILIKSFFLQLINRRRQLRKKTSTNHSKLLIMKLKMTNRILCFTCSVYVEK